LGSTDRGFSVVRDRGNWLKAQPVVYRWTNGAGWVKPTSYEVMKIKAVNHKPMIHLEGTLNPTGWRGGQFIEKIQILIIIINF
ncbi:MAG: hypothetical protein RXS19_05895, partial [Caldisphaera sp.]